MMTKLPPAERALRWVVIISGGKPDEKWGEPFLG